MGKIRIESLDKSWITSKRGKRRSVDSASSRIHGRIRDVNGVLHYLRRPGIKGVLRVALDDEGNLCASAQALPNAKPRAHILVESMDGSSTVHQPCTVQQRCQISMKQQMKEADDLMIPEMDSESSQKKNSRSSTPPNTGPEKKTGP